MAEELIPCFDSKKLMKLGSRSARYVEWNMTFFMEAAFGMPMVVGREAEYVGLWFKGPDSCGSVKLLQYWALLELTKVENILAI
jgi:hypothetical protein